MVVKFTYEFEALEIDSEAVIRAIQSAATQVANGFTASQMSDALSPEPGAVKYPIQWTSEKQRRAFFATNGFGGGIPSKRTGKLGDSWVMTSEDFREGIQSGAEITIANTAPHAKFVIGAPPGLKPMQGFHLNTGWQAVEPRLLTFSDIVVGEMKAAVASELQRTVIIKEI